MTHMMRSLIEICYFEGIEDEWQSMVNKLIERFESMTGDFRIIKANFMLNPNHDGAITANVELVYPHFDGCHEKIEKVLDDVIPRHEFQRWIELERGFYSL